ncbi:MAG: hypothetical protein ACRBF0_18365 [Calditrichia bacterium]
MNYEIDHLFILSEFEAPQAEELVKFGWTEGSRNTHPGQGSANRRFYCRNAMLEFLWITDKVEATTGEAGRLKLYDRSKWRNNKSSPFGICLRPTSLPPQALPFPTWLYKPEYFPDIAGIQMSDEPDSLLSPEVFMLPFPERQEDYPPKRQQPLKHQFGGEYLTKTTLHGQFPDSSLALAELAKHNIIELKQGSSPTLELTLDSGTHGRMDFRPQIPLIINY